MEDAIAALKTITEQAAPSRRAITNRMKEARGTYDNYNDKHASTLYQLGADHTNYQQTVNQHKEMLNRYLPLMGATEEILEVIDKANKPMDILWRLRKLLSAASRTLSSFISTALLTS